MEILQMYQKKQSIPVRSRQCDRTLSNVHVTKSSKDNFSACTVHLCSGRAVLRSCWGEGKPKTSTVKLVATYSSTRTCWVRRGNGPGDRELSSNIKWSLHLELELLTVWARRYLIHLKVLASSYEFVRKQVGGLA